MRTWSIVDDDLNDVGELTDFVRKTLHDVFDQHAHDLLRLFMLVFH